MLLSFESTQIKGNDVIANSFILGTTDEADLRCHSKSILASVC